MAIFPCVCKHEFQDKEHGQGKRVFNQRKSSVAGVTLYGCTVCNREHKKTSGKKKKDDAAELVAAKGGTKGKKK